MTFVPKFFYIRRLDDDSASREIDLITSMQNLSLLRESNNEDTNTDQREASGSRQQTLQDLPSDEQNRQMKFKQILGVLNKMTPDKLHKLVLQIDPEPLDLVYIKMLAELIFSKALDEVLYVQLYARLCENLLSMLPSDSAICFRGLLLTLCHSGVQALVQLDDPYINSLPDMKRFEFKRKLMTLFRFVGELCCLGSPPGSVVSPDASWSIMKQLIERGQEIHLEAAYNLLFTLAIRKHVNVWPEFLWSTVASLAKGGSSSRIRFMFLELVEMRARGWAPRRAYSQLMLPLADPVRTPPHSDSEASEQVPYSKGF